MWKIILLVLVIFQSEGFMSHLIGVDIQLGRWMYSGLMLLSVYLAVIKMLNGDGREKGIFYYPLAAFGVFTIVSAVSALFLFPKPVGDWLPSLYVFMPIFIFYLLYILNYEAKEIVVSVAVVSLLVSFLLILDRVIQLPVLDGYERISTFFFDEKRRVVLLKNEMVLGFVIFASIFVFGKGSENLKKICFLFGSVVFLVQALIMESRMAFMSMGVSSITLLVLSGMTTKTVRIWLASIFLIILLFPIVFESYIAKISQMSLYDDESNIFVRYESAGYFFDLFLESKLLGIGVMSPTGIVNNVLALDGRHNIVDTGFLSALFQFGFPGFFVWAVFTFRSASVFKRYSCSFENKEPHSAAMYAFLIGSTVSLLPLSLFTQSWCVNTGGIILYLAWVYDCRLAGRTVGRRQ